VRVFVSYQDSAFDLIGGLAKAKVSPANTQDVAALGFGKTVT
jgi:xyloglucan fucosyltransferase